MIAPDTAAELRAERRFDIGAAVLIGAIALLAALLAVVQVNSGQAATRADLQAARLAADLSARLSVSAQAVDAAAVAQQTALMLGMEAVSRQIAALDAKDDTASAVAAAQTEAYKQLQAALAATSETSGNAPVDAYTAGLLHATETELEAELAEQNRQVDLAQAASSNEQEATLGLSLLALGGVLTGLAAVLKEGRPGWTAMGAAGLLVVGAAVLGAMALV
jgi:hypothetical protein